MRNLSRFIAVLVIFSLGQASLARSPSHNRESSVPSFSFAEFSLPERSDEALLFTAVFGSQALGVCPAPTSRGLTETSAVCWAEPVLLSLAAAAAGPTLKYAPEAVAASKKLYEESYKDQARIYLAVVAGKGCELLLAQDFGFDKATAKALGKICKNIQAGKPIWDVTTAVVTTFGAAKMAERLVESKMGLPIIASVFVGAKITEYFSHTRILEALKPGVTSENHQLVDFWVLRPAFKSGVTGYRYAAEKLVQLDWTDAYIPLVTGALTRLPFMTTAASSILSKGGSIGLSKVASALVSQTIVSSAKMYVDGDFSKAKLLKDISSGLTLTLALGFVVPTSLVVFTRKGVVVIFLTCTALSIAGIL